MSESSDLDKQIQILMLKQQLAAPPTDTIDKQKFTVDVKLAVGVMIALAAAMYTAVTRMNAIEASMEKSSETKAQVAELVAKVAKIEAKQDKLSDKADAFSTKLETQEYAIKAANTKIEDTNRSIASLSSVRGK